MLNQDTWILSRHPGLNTLAKNWTERYERDGPEVAQDLLEQRKRQYHIDVQVLNDGGDAVVPGTFRAAPPPLRLAATMMNGNSPGVASQRSTPAPTRATPTC